jgi:site-specific recombinase XerD
MDILTSFEQHLFQDNNRVSARTVQLYENDVSQFISWYEQKTNSQFHPQEIKHKNITAYFSALFYSEKTIERHWSSIRRFFHFLVSHGYRQDNPLLSAAQKNIPDPWRIEDFASYLYVMNYSPVTIKCYKLDLKHFFTWIEKTSHLARDRRITSVPEELIKKYKGKLQKENASSSVINRRLAAIGKHCRWYQQ